MPTWLDHASHAVYGVAFVAFVAVLTSKAIREEPSSPRQIIRRSPVLQVLLLVLAVTILVSLVDLGLMIKNWVGA